MHPLDRKQLVLAPVDWFFNGERERGWVLPQSIDVKKRWKDIFKTFKNAIKTFIKLDTVRVTDKVSKIFPLS